MDSRGGRDSIDPPAAEKNYKELKVWQKAYPQCLKIYKESLSELPNKNFLARKFMANVQDFR